MDKTVVSIKFRPKCPSCGIVGLDFITEFESNTKRKSGEALYELVACIKCGRVYGVLGGQWYSSAAQVKEVHERPKQIVAKIPYKSYLI